jgi:hypothetical protein
MSSCLFAFPNLADAAAVSGGDWNAAMPLANVLDPVIGNRARTINDALASTQFDIDLGTNRGVRVVALAGHNFSSAAVFRIRASTVAGDFSAPLHDSGWTGVWAGTYLSGSVPWESPLFWTAVQTMTGLDGGQPTLIHLLAEETGARYWRIEINDQSNSDGYVEIGRLFLGSAFQPAANFNWGESIGYADDSTIDTAWSGAEYYDRRTVRRVATLQFDWLTDAEALERVLDMQRLQGVTREILFVWDPGDTVYFSRRSFLARAETLSPIENVRLNTHGTAIRLRELI